MNITILEVGLSWTRQLSCNIEKEGKRKSLQSNKNCSQRRSKYKSLFEYRKSYQSNNAILNDEYNMDNI